MNPTKKYGTLGQLNTDIQFMLNPYNTCFTQAYTQTHKYTTNAHFFLYLFSKLLTKEWGSLFYPRPYVKGWFSNFPILRNHFVELPRSLFARGSYSLVFSRSLESEFKRKIKQGYVKVVNLYFVTQGFVCLIVLFLFIFFCFFNREPQLSA